MSLSKNTNFLPMTLYFHEVFLTAFSNYEILLSLVSVFTCSLSVTDGVIWDEIFSKVTHCVGIMGCAAYFIVIPTQKQKEKSLMCFDVLAFFERMPIRVLAF